MFSIENFSSYTGMPVEDIAPERFEWLLAEAEALIRATKPSLPDDVAEWPQSAVIVGMRVVARAYAQESGSVPIGTTQQQNTAGPFSQSRSFSSDSTSGGLWLSKQDKFLLRGRGGGAYGIDTLPVDRDYRSAAMRHCDEWVW